MRRLKLLTMLTIFLVTSWLPHARATDMVSISTYLAKNDTSDPAVAGYFTMRCAALTGYVKSIMPSSTPKAKLNQMEDQFSQFLLLSAQSFQLATGDDTETTFERLDGALKATLDKQVQISNNHYISTGSYLREVDFQDFELCSNLAISLRD